MIKMECSITDGPAEPELDWSTDEQAELREHLEDLALSADINDMKNLWDNETRNTA